APSDRRASSRKDGVDFVQIVDNPTPYVGEQITYKAEIASALGIAEVELEDLDFNGFRKETFGKKRELVRNIAGTRTRVHSVRDSLFPNAPGKISIPRRAITVKARAPVRRQNRGSWDLFDDVLSDFMSQGEIVERRLSADQIDVDVRPLPPAPPGISGYVPVGDIQIRWTLDKREIQFGESFTLEVTLRGDGDLRPVELPDLSTRAEVKIYPDKAEMQTEVEGDKIVFVKRFRTAIVPRRSGELELPEMVIPTFNPSKGEYRLLRVPPQHLNVVGKGGVDEQEPITAPRVSAPIEPQLAAADDLLPQHVGNEILESETEIPSWLVFLVLIGFPIAMIAMALLRRHAEQVRAEPERVAQRLALKKSLQDLQQFKGSSAGDLDAFDVV
ncbi:MAG: BatD family protein, partial [Deltaproteobacteria bacterium]|nr:BatD family protein [Deltaproteobacteria bacterium]